MLRSLRQSLPHSSLRRLTAARISHHRWSSSKTQPSEIIEVEIDQVPSSQINSREDVIAVGVKKLEEVIRRISVRLATPDWLPFLPGYSFMVLRRVRAGKSNPAAVGDLAEVIGKLASSDLGKAQILPVNLPSEEEMVPFMSHRGWPSSSFFIPGSSPIHPIQVVQVELDFKVEDDDESSDSSHSTEEED